MEDIIYSIYKNYSDKPALDFAFLRRTGIELIQKLSANTWTDFNLHDPGVTILESICYGLTDLAYRTNFSIIDLLTNKEGIIDSKANSFFSRKEILSTSPVLIKDFRKWVIDSVEEVDNVWMEEILSAYAHHYLKGAYRTIIQANYMLYDKASKDNSVESFKNDIIDKVKSLLAACRNIAEDFDEFIVLEPQYLQIEAELVINKNAVPEEVLAQVYNRIEQALNPRLKFYTEKELLEKGYNVEDIYDGPLLKNGIIPDTELTKIKTTIDVSDLVRTVSDMTDVIHINSFHIKDENSTEYSDKPLTLKKNHYPFLRPVFSPEIKLYHDRLLIPVNAPVFYSMLQRLHDTLNREFVSAVHNAPFDHQEKGVYRHIGEYSSIQNMFPVGYRIGHDGIESNASDVRKAQVKQLKAYLMFFEQVMAGYLSQLANVSSLFSSDITSAHAHTYFFQPLYTVPGVAEILKSFTAGNTDWQSFVDDNKNEYLSTLEKITEANEEFISRKKKIFDHLLSRFNIVADNYPVTLFELLYKEFSNGKTDEELQWKSGLLQHVLYITKYRTRAFDYLQYQPEEKIAYGFEFNLHHLLYIQYKNRKRLSDAATRHMPTPLKFHKHRDHKNADARPVIKTYHHEGEELKVIDERGEHASFHINKRSANYFNWGTDKKNYKIIPDPDNTGKKLVVYKSPKDENWNIVRRESDYRSAKQGLKKLIKTLLQISIDSEGFYIVEHLLLAPPRDSKVFGFTVHDSSGKPLLKEAGWLSFQEREDTIEKIMFTIKQPVDTPVKNRIGSLEGLCKILLQSSVSGSDYITPRQLNEMDDKQSLPLSYKILTTLQTFTEGGENFNPRFEFNVLHWDGSILPEKFYNSRVTIVFPSWPLRFQQQGFKKFAEDTFLGNLPVHLRADFLWLNISKMKRFEDLYFSWLESLKDDNKNLRRFNSILLVPFLYNEIKNR